MISSRDLPLSHGIDVNCSQWRSHGRSGGRTPLTPLVEKLWVS